MCSFLATSEAPHAIPSIQTFPHVHPRPLPFTLCVTYRAPILRAVTLSTIFLRLIEILLSLGFISFTELYLSLCLLNYLHNYPSIAQGQAQMGLAISSALHTS